MKGYYYKKKHVKQIDLGKGHVKSWAPEVKDNKQVLEQVARISRLPFVDPYVAIMPDVHPGETAMVGSVIPTRNAILPTVIGGDLGCGIAAVQLPMRADEVRERGREILQSVYTRVPVGSSTNSVTNDRVANHPIFRRDVLAWNGMSRRLREMLQRQLGSLGGGNHFIEFQYDSDDQVWLMVHTGSRGLGVLLRDFYVTVAAASIEVDPSLFHKCPYIPLDSDVGAAYLKDLEFAMDYAAINRREILVRLLEILHEIRPDQTPRRSDEVLGRQIDVAHNGIWRERHFDQALLIHRKGAAPAHEGQLSAIPGTMATCSFIAEGRGNPYSFCSTSHGAGRVMSRAEARRRVTRKELQSSMHGVVASLKIRHHEEAPAAYKEIRSVMREQKDLATVKVELRPLISVKG